MQGNPHVRFDERDVETELWSSHLGTARRKGRKQTCPAYRHRATSRLYPVKPFAARRDDRPPSTPHQRLKSTLTRPSLPRQRAIGSTRKRPFGYARRAADLNQQSASAEPATR